MLPLRMPHQLQWWSDFGHAPAVCCAAPSSAAPGHYLAPTFTVLGIDLSRDGSPNVLLLPQVSCGAPMQSTAPTLWSAWDRPGSQTPLVRKCVGPALSDWEQVGKEGADGKEVWK